VTKIAVAYHSDSGTTKILAEAVHEGAASVEGVAASLNEIDRGCIVEGHYANDALLDSLDEADAIIFGCPTFMGDVSAPMKAFLDATLSRWSQRTWSGKVAAGFTVSSTPSGDKLSALTSLVMNAMQHGMIWVGLDQTPINPDQLNRLSFYLGVGGQAEYGGETPAIHAPDRATGVIHGERVARIAQRLASAPR
jgi:NAD(P)H dehydrogenase (quinone)